MAIPTTDKLLDLLRRSKLVEEERLMPFLDKLSARSGRHLSETPEQFTDALVEEKLITRWQADMLLSGKHKGFKLGKYKLLGHIGKGGMSQVYLAEHLLMQRRVAIKVLPKNRVD
ncbi:MAG: serine/threonine protein kinase, partial [Pirellulales bacterium]|nr:serine/threonine protein kinase [Pirellulales bacterium]